MIYRRDDIFALLTYPRRILGTLVQLEGCSHAGFLDAADPDCHECDYLAGCRWLYSNDEFADLSAKPIEKLIEALGLATELIEAQMTRGQHRSRSCKCESCRWVRECRVFLRAHNPQNPY